MPSKPAPCPHCGVVMRTVSARARSGYCLLLDQCPRCGGVWCDRWELYPLDGEEAQRIDGLDDARLLGAATAKVGPGRCPRCTAVLRPFHDRALPPDARIERCAVCDGMWLNRGELARVKQHQPTRPPLPDATVVARLGAQLGASREWSAVGNLDAATYAAEPSPDADETSWRGALRTLGPWAVLAGLLQLLLR